MSYETRRQERQIERDRINREREECNRQIEECNRRFEDIFARAHAFYTSLIVVLLALPILGVAMIAMIRLMIWWRAG